MNESDLSRLSRDFGGLLRCFFRLFCGWVARYKYGLCLLALYEYSGR